MLHTPSALLFDSCPETCPGGIPHSNVEMALSVMIPIPERPVTPVPMARRQLTNGPTASAACAAFAQPARAARGV